MTEFMNVPILKRKISDDVLKLPITPKDSNLYTVVTDAGLALTYVPTVTDLRDRSFIIHYFFFGNQRFGGKYCHLFILY